jgi:hypothetical protein
MKAHGLLSLVNKESCGFWYKNKRELRDQRTAERTSREELIVSRLNNDKVTRGH